MISCELVCSSRDYKLSTIGTKAHKKRTKALPTEMCNFREEEDLPLSSMKGLSYLVDVDVFCAHVLVSVSASASEVLRRIVVNRKPYQNIPSKCPIIASVIFITNHSQNAR